MSFLTRTFPSGAIGRSSGRLLEDAEVSSFDEGFTDEASTAEASTDEAVTRSTACGSRASESFVCFGFTTTTAK